jgi:hypothetical protein
MERGFPQQIRGLRLLTWRQEKGKKGAARFELWRGWFGLVEALYLAAPLLPLFATS